MKTNGKQLLYSYKPNMVVDFAQLIRGSDRRLSRAQEVGLALGAQAGEARLRDVVTSAGFSHFRRAAQTPFNLVFEARP